MNIEFRKSLGRQLSEARRAKGYNQTEFAQSIRIARGHLSKYENGHVIEPSFDVLLKAAKVLDTDFVVAGYKLSKETLRPARTAEARAEKQLTFTFYKNRTFRQAAVRVTSLKRGLVISASVEGANAGPVRAARSIGTRKAKVG